MGPCLPSDEVAGYALFVLADAVMYVSLSWFLAKSFQASPFQSRIGFLIWMVPFIYSLTLAGSLLNVLWMLIFTPFYGVSRHDSNLSAAGNVVLRGILRKPSRNILLEKKIQRNHIGQIFTKRYERKILAEFSVVRQ